MNAIVDPIRQAWLAQRRKGLGGSDVAAMLGLSKYRTPYQLWLDKTGRSEDEGSGEAGYWGNALEDIVAREFSKRSGLKVQRVNSIIQHPTLDFALANIDRAIVNPAIAGNVRIKDGRLTTDQILECKTANQFLQNQWGDDHESIPDYYLTQCQWYLGNTQADICHLAVLIGGQKFKQYQIQRDDELIAILHQEAQAFWQNHVLADMPPDPTTIDDCLHRWARHTDGKVIDADQSLIDLITEFKEMKSALKDGEEEADKLKLEIVKRLEDAECIVIDGNKKLLSYKAQSSARLDSKALKSAHPDIAEQFTKTTATRVLRMA